MSKTTTLSFKASEDFKEKLNILADQKGINLSAYIKMLLTESLNQELNHLTQNGLTVAEELEILHSEMNDEAEGPFETAEDFMNSLDQ